MPLSQEEFDLGRSDLTVPIADFLRGFPDQAFTAEEIRLTLVQSGGRDATEIDIEQALEVLVQQARVRAKEIDGLRWYNMPRRRLGFLREQ